MMQSDWISFCGDVVCDNILLVHRDEDSILDPKYKKQLFWNIYYEDFNFKSYCGKCTSQWNAALNNKELIKLGYKASVVLACIFE